MLNPLGRAGRIGAAGEGAQGGKGLAPAPSGDDLRVPVPGPPRRRAHLLARIASGRVLAGLAAPVVVLALVGCGVEVPDDIAAKATSTTSTTSTVPQTTAVPTSDDELEQTLIDNGFSLTEAQCGATALREQLSENEITEITGLRSIDEIDESLAAEYRDAISPCVEDGAEGDGDEGGGN